LRLFLILATSLLHYSAPVQAAENTLAADWTLTTPDGRSVNLQATAQEQTTVIRFWATWCPYCKALMPHLQSIRLEYGESVRILAVSIKEDGDPVEFVASAGYDFTVLPDGDAVADLYDVRGTPGVFVIDQELAIRFDLRKLPRIEPPDIGKSASNSRKAAFRAPYWAAEIRKSIDAVASAASQ